MKIFKLLITYALITNASLALSYQILSKKENNLFMSLYEIYPNTDNGISQPSIIGKYNYELKIHGMNEAEECLHDDFSLNCKGQTIFINISDGLLGGKTFGIKIGKAYSVSVEKIDFKKNDCVLIELSERVFTGNRYKPKWAEKKYSICISPEGVKK